MYTGSSSGSAILIGNKFTETKGEEKRVYLVVA